jgi:hypothetical protein
MVARRRSTVIQDMQKLVDIVSMLPLEPVYLNPLSQEDVSVRIWLLIVDNLSLP